MQNPTSKDTPGSFEPQTIDPDTTASAIRQQWLELTVATLRPRFEQAGYTVPGNIRISIGWPRLRAYDGRIGECWSPKLCTDGFHELFISPEMRDTIPIIGVITHEIVHAVVGTEAGHRKTFKQCANSVGLIGRMRSTTESESFREWMRKTIISEFGEYPAGAIVLEDGRKKQTTRMIGCQCKTCGYLARTTNKWITEVGPPWCPVHGAMIVCTSEVKPNE